MKLYLIKTPVIIQNIFNKWIWRSSKDQKVLFLTFDDGPTPEITSFVLDQLNDYAATATFFCIGKNMVAHQPIVKAIINGNHTLGNHTYAHVKGWKTTNADYLKSVADTQQLIDRFRSEEKQENHNYFRPPYGKIRPAQARKLRALGYKIVMWDVLSADFDRNVSEEESYQNVIKHASQGSVIVFHDSLKAAEKLRYVLPKVLNYYTEKGYRFEALPAFF